MRIGIVSPRYGDSFVGGAELHLRLFAERLRERGHDVLVLTTCATDHFTWKNVLPRGRSVVGGVPVVRYPVSVSPDLALVARLHDGVDNLTEHQQLELVRNKGHSEQLLTALAGSAGDRDALVFAPALMPTTVFGARVRPERSLVMPCLHDEAYARFGAVQETLAGVAGVIPSTEAELRLARRLIPTLPPARIVGAGFSLPGEPCGARFRDAYRVRGDFVTYAGRREGGKNFMLLAEWATAYDVLRADPSPASLVVLGTGPAVLPAVARDLVRELGFVDDAVKYDAFAAALAVVNLSLAESLSFVLMEAWLCGTPVIVHADSEVCREHVELSGGRPRADPRPQASVSLP
jgi:glycosyltransferase involved in cell wall biosynthesis